MFSLETAKKVGAGQSPATLLLLCLGMQATLPGHVKNSKRRNANRVGFAGVEWVIVVSVKSLRIKVESFSKGVCVCVCLSECVYLCVSV